MSRTLPRYGLLLALFVSLLGCAARSPAPSPALVSSPTPTPAPTLDRLCKDHTTDKCHPHHNYVAMYEMLFGPMRERPLRILEVGVARGHSMRLWEAYFPAAQIFGLDIHPKTEYDSPRIKTLVADQGKREDLVKALAVAGTGFDIVMDDGGHRMDQQQITLAVLFPTLKSGALYILEDVHTSFPHLYPGYGVDPDGQNSTYAMIDRFVRTGQISSKYLTAAETDYLNEHISHCLYFWRSTRVHSDFLACWKK